MPRIAKADVNAALALAAKSIITAGGPDGRTSRAEMKAALASLPKEQRALADVFFKFIDHRDFKKGAQVTSADVNKAVAYAKQHLVAKYDLNSNGLSSNEISKMSLTGQSALSLAKALKAAAVPDAPSAPSATSTDSAVHLALGKKTGGWQPIALDIGDMSVGLVAAAGGTLSITVNDKTIKLRTKWGDSGGEVFARLERAFAAQGFEVKSTVRPDLDGTTGTIRVR